MLWRDLPPRSSPGFAEQPGQSQAVAGVMPPLPRQPMIPPKVTGVHRVVANLMERELTYMHTPTTTTTARAPKFSFQLYSAPGGPFRTVLNGPFTTTTPDSTRTPPDRSVVSRRERGWEAHHGASGCIQPAKSLSWSLGGPFTPRSLADPCGSPYELPLIVREAWDHETAVRMPIFRGSSGDGADSVTSVGGRPLFPFRHPFGKVPQSEEAGDRVP